MLFIVVLNVLVHLFSHSLLFLLGTDIIWDGPVLTMAA